MVGIVVLAGCAAPGGAPGPTRPSGDDAPAIARPSEAKPPVADSTVQALMDEAAVRARAGDLDGAAAQLERALRVAPRDPRLWQQLAVLRLAQNRPGQAESLAAKSNDLSDRNPALEALNWRLIAEARRLRGDEAGAEQALNRAAELGNP